MGIQDAGLLDAGFESANSDGRSLRFRHPAMLAIPAQPNVAMTGAWSLVPTSASTGQLTARAASDWVAST